MKGRETMVNLFKGQETLGEMLIQDCPNNDCIVYRNVYEMYKEISADYERLSGTISDTTAHALESRIIKLHKELTEMYFSNYAVQEYRKACRA